MEDITKWIKDSSLNSRFIDFKDKESVVNYLSNNMLNNTIQMFDVKGMPSTIPVDYIERLLQTDGYVAIVKEHDKLFAVHGQMGGVRDFNYRPTRFIVSNPYLLDHSKVYKIYYGDETYENPIYDSMPYDGECVVIMNDVLGIGMLPINSFYASQLVENLLTKRVVTIASRATNVFVSNDADDAENFKSFVKSLLKGDLDLICADDILSRAKTMPFADKGHEALTDLIEDQQYIKAGWYNSVGLQANYNMKRESINSNESQLNKDAILPFADGMLAQRRLGFKRCKELFGVDWEVEFSSAWRDTRITIQQAQDAIDPETQIVEDKTKRLVEEKENENT